MKTISLEVSEKTAEAIKQMSEDELENLKAKMSDWIKTKSQFTKTLNALQEEAERNGLTPDILADILALDKEEQSNLFGTSE
ncbi:hypothetical protein MASR2M47_09770 [Draconibacterium sp.]|jgi:hypothetical protein